MTKQEFNDRHPAAVNGMFADVVYFNCYVTVWSSNRITKKLMLYNGRTVKYKDMPAEEYDELRNINKYFNKLYDMEERLNRMEADFDI